MNGLSVPQFLLVAGIVMLKNYAQSVDNYFVNSFFDKET